MVGGEGQAEMEAEESLVDGGEGERLPGGQEGQQQGGVPGDVRGEQAALDEADPPGVVAQVLEAVDLQGDAFEEGEGRKSPAWWRVSQARKPVRVTAWWPVKTRTSAATSGSFSVWLGLAWWRLCFSFHQA